MSERWCEHLEWQEKTQNRGYGYWGYRPTSQAYFSNMDSHGWKQCPICMTPRPKPRKWLAEKLYMVAVGGLGEWDNCYLKLTYENLATCALEHFVAVVDENTGKNFNHGMIMLSAEEFKQAMRESI